jgi:hypothetical protein
MTLAIIAAKNMIARSVAHAVGIGECQLEEPCSKHPEITNDEK